MGHTMAEKILGNHATGQPAKAGEVVVAKVDSTMIHDARADGAFGAVERLGISELPYEKNTALVLQMSWLCTTCLCIRSFVVFGCSRVVAGSPWSRAVHNRGNNKESDCL